MARNFERRSEHLTPREREVILLMAQGLSNREIADRLAISFATAKTHVSDVIGRLGAANREEAVAVWKAESGAIRKMRRTLSGVVPMLLIPRAIGGGVALVVLVAGISIVANNQADARPPGELVIALDDLIVGVPREYYVDGLGSGHFGDPYPLWVIAHEDGTYDAFLGRDPHSNCVVPWRGDYAEQSFSRGTGESVWTVTQGPQGAFKADCSGWTFARTGEASFGASPRGLDGFDTTIDGGSLVVSFERFRLGACRPGVSEPPACSGAGAPIYVDRLPPAVISDWGVARATATAKASP